MPWTAELQPNVYKVDDNQWHFVTRVVDRAVGRLSLYVDGAERSSSAMPGGFGAQLNAGQSFKAGHLDYYDGWLGGSEQFTGTLDEIRVSATAHTAQHILEVFKRHGVTVIPAAAGTPFDPNVHQAVTQQPAKDVPPGAVTAVLEKGFLLHDRVLRPASVIVASEPNT
jgi:hypothetical protein